jgi:hypothetical protein
MANMIITRPPRMIGPLHKYKAYKLPSNIVVEWITFFLHIREVPGSKVGPETGYPDWGGGVRCLPQSLQTNVGIAL